MDLTVVQSESKHQLDGVTNFGPAWQPAAETLPQCHSLLKHLIFLQDDVKDTDNISRAKRKPATVGPSGVRAASESITPLFCQQNELQAMEQLDRIEDPSWRSRVFLWVWHVSLQVTGFCWDRSWIVSVVDVHMNVPYRNMSCLSAQSDSCQERFQEQYVLLPKLCRLIEVLKGEVCFGRWRRSELVTSRSLHWHPYRANAPSSTTR